MFAPNNLFDLPGSHSNIEPANEIKAPSAGDGMPARDVKVFAWQPAFLLFTMGSRVTVILRDEAVTARIQIA